MTQQVCNGAALACTFGAAPGTLTVIPATGVMAATQPAATVMDYAPMVNVATFGMCMSPSNPQVSGRDGRGVGGADAAALHSRDVEPLDAGQSHRDDRGNAALTSTDMCMCMWGGQITITSPGQESVTDDG